MLCLIRLDSGDTVASVNPIQLSSVIVVVGCGYNFCRIVHPLSVLRAYCRQQLRLSFDMPLFDMLFKRLNGRLTVKQAMLSD